MNRCVRWSTGLLMVAVLAVLLPEAGARFARPDLEKIPVDRLIKNLEDRAEKNPKDGQVRFHLARLHAMAYALKTESVDVRKNKEEQGAWFGFTPGAVPFKPVATEDATKRKQAHAELDKALAAYQATLALEPDNLPAQLGQAWCLEQSGNKEAAIKAYRKVIENGWMKEKDLRSGSLGGNYITVEAAGYLIPLLDAEKDKDEIQTLKERRDKLNRLPRPVTPLAIPLRTGLTARDLEDATARVAFDADGTGLGKHWTWITPQAGWLVFDPKRTARVTSGLQLFGNVSFWLFWDNGYEALSALDDNGDGQLTGKELEGLAIWQDVNGNGICDPGEVRPLSDYGIVALSCRYERDLLHPDRILFSPRGVVFADGSTRPTFDLVLKQR
jgi:tetratricopeptide (TPR) repeat protein